MDTVEIILPISRSQHLPLLFASLEMLACDSQKTSLLTYVDGDQSLFDQVVQFTESSKFSQKRCVRRPGSTSKSVPVGKEARRRPIATIHNELKALVGDCNYVFGLEDDTIIPGHTLKTLLRDYSLHPFAGFIEGVELGRHGWAHVGAWSCDNVYEPTSLTTLPVGKGIQEIDAGGLYCFLTKREHYVSHEFDTFERNTLGPDVNFGIALRREGYKNYIDWSISCKHLRKDGTSLTMANTTVYQVEVRKVQRGKRVEWVQKLMPHGFTA